MSAITPNFNFRGNCYEAIRLYQQAFHGEITVLIRNRDAIWEDSHNHLSAQDKELIYHAEMRIGSQRIMMCDNTELADMPSSALSLTVTMDTQAEVMQAYETMKVDAKIIYPLQSTSYSSCFVSFFDKFGFRWTIMTEQAEK